MSIDAIARRMVEVLGYPPAGLFSDFDGALSEIASTPDGAVAYPGAAEALAAIASRVDCAGLITGRAVDDIANKLPIDDLIVVGNHGLEWWDHGKRHDHEAGTAAIVAITKVLETTEARLARQMDISKMIWENKRLSGTIHFRNVDEPESTEKLLLPIVQPLAQENGLRCTAGKMIVELRPMAMVTKGTALTEIISTKDLESAVFIGDDVTDVDGFKALHTLRSEGKQTLAVGVVAADAHPDVATYSDVAVGSVDEMVSVLKRVGELLGER